MQKTSITDVLEITFSLCSVMNQINQKIRRNHESLLSEGGSV